MVSRDFKFLIKVCSWEVFASFMMFKFGELFVSFANTDNSSTRIGNTIASDIPIEAS